MAWRSSFNGILRLSFAVVSVSGFDSGCSKQKQKYFKYLKLFISNKDFRIRSSKLRVLMNS